MGTKSCAVWYRQSGNSSDAAHSYNKIMMQACPLRPRSLPLSPKTGAQESWRDQQWRWKGRKVARGGKEIARAAPLAATDGPRVRLQDQYHGQPHGMFSADECFGGRALNRGIELCAVAEQMYSLEAIFQIQGDVMFMDRCERIAYNAWPGTSAQLCRGVGWVEKIARPGKAVK
jgi:hypothetical protein